MKKEVREYFKKIGAKGGKVKGESKRRGDSAYYASLRKGRGKKGGGK